MKRGAADDDVLRLSALADRILIQSVSNHFKLESENAASWLASRDAPRRGLYEMGGVWGVTIGAILVVVFFVARAAMRQEEAENRKRRDEEDQDERARLRRSTAQRNLRERIESSRDAALSSYARIPLSLLSAEELLDTAQQEFEEGAFSPFWEAVEAALGKLARVDQDMRIVQNMALSYAEAAHS